MAQEIKNTFLKSKMNKDLDDRILPNGEYRDARNISVGRSEDNNVGALENVIGNNLVTGTDIRSGLTVIGILNDNSNDKLFLFLTDYLDPDAKNPTNAPSTSKHYIYSYDNVSGNYTLLVQGEFLNFSKTNPIIGINLVENLLFWTDNRNQPRKINVNLAVAFEAGSVAAGEDYYRSEHQISVAKYNPYQAISLYNRADLQVLTGATTTIFEVSGNREQELQSFVGATVVCAEATTPTVGTDYVKVVSALAISTNGPTRITVSPALNSAPTVNQYVSLIKSTMSNENSDNTWPGDPDYLEDKFVRFSYRFKFDDNEYSLMAPFTQIAYIPKQNGYFIDGDEDAAYQSTIVGFMENLVQNIGLVIPLPCSANGLVSDYKISELEILFRESDSIAVKVLDSVASGDISGEAGVNNYYTYEYQSRKPYRTLPEAQTVRVYDKVPVRALAQESSGNRIIYGNFIDQQTPPDSINYNCRIAHKSSTGVYNNFVEYPNSSVKRNRNYQVGFVLADKFGRQSSVILSSVDAGLENSGQFYAGSTIYSPYDLNSGDTDVISWFGDAIQVLINEPITSEIDSAAGTPGLYAIKQQEVSTGEGFAVAAGFVGTPPSISGNVYTFTLDSTAFPNNTNIPIASANNYLRGAYTDFVEVTNVVNTSGAIYEVTTDGPISDVYLRTDNLPSGDPDLKFAYTINDLGWYSYKIVVKQTEQEYYNVYLPGIVNGYPGQENHTSGTGTENGVFPANEVNKTAHTVLFNDNINKVPRDLAEVGPEQKQFRSSVTLYGRVTNTLGDATTTSNIQYYPRLAATGKNAIDHTATAIAEADEFNMGFADLSTSNTAHNLGGINGNLTFYQIDTNPLIARISTTEKSIGATNIATSGDNMLPFLAVYETAPFESNLDLYWESTSEGLIVDLNADIASSNTGAVAFTAIGWDFTEATTNGTAVTAFFQPLDNQGATYVADPTAELISATNGVGENVGFFELVAGATGGPNQGKFQLKYTGEGIVYTQSSALVDIYTFVIKVTTSTGDISNIQIGGQIGGVGALKNLQPSFSTIADRVRTINSSVLISATDWGTIANGTSLTGDPKKEQLLFTFEGAGGSVIPDNWTMDPNSGELTQDTPNSGFTGNPLSVYNITVRLSDANGIGTPANAASGYTSLYAEQAVEIRMEPATVNAGALSTTCTIMPASPPPTEVIDPATGVVGPFNNNQQVACVYYVSATNLTPGGINDNNVFFNNGIENPNSSGENINVVNYRIGTDCHRTGTISFSLNTFSPYNGSTANINLFKTPLITFYYRTLGETEWKPIPRSAESNRVAFPTSIASPTFDGPEIVQDSILTSGVVVPVDRLILDYGPDDVWVQTIRSFNYQDFDISGSIVAGADGIEYAIVADNIIQRPPNTKANGLVRFWVIADDLEYPTCVPWQGKNAVTENGGPGNLFEYRRSTESNDSVAYNVASVGSIYARSPYGDYVNEFYTGATNFTPYIPSLPYINTRLLRTIGTTLDSWTTLNDPPLPAYPTSGGGPASDVNVQWVVGYDTVNGKKLINTGISGVSARQTTNNTEFNRNLGTLRIHKN
ncbi:MAG: hypothetical protein CMJ25_26690 [Phycisphaerae bacterium]|nr:hypothetical protein [Phycisphaerae bacterium]